MSFYPEVFQNDYKNDQEFVPNHLCIYYKLSNGFNRNQSGSQRIEKKKLLLIFKFCKSASFDKTGAKCCAVSERKQFCEIMQ